MSLLQIQQSMVCHERGVLYKCTLVRSPRCSRHRHIDEADTSTPVAVDQAAVNCLEKAAWSFTAMRNRCRSLRANVIFRRPLTIFRVVWWKLVHCFQTRITVELFRCTRSVIARMEKSSFSKTNNPPPFKLRKLLEFLLFQS